MANDSGDKDDNHDDIPLHKTQGFGAGLHKQKISFVPASDSVLKTTSDSDQQGSMTKPARSAADFYMSVVLSGKDQDSEASGSGSTGAGGEELFRCLSILESLGWDPDARRGLGSDGNGIRDPIKAKAKSDTLGLGMKLPKEVLLSGKTPSAKVEKKSLDAKQSRKRAEEEKKRHDALAKYFYGNPDVDKYLGS